ncbi:MAG: hypothetical protein RLO38_20535, partial [Roseovarius confluentis]
MFDVAKDGPQIHADPHAAIAEQHGIDRPQGRVRTGRRRGRGRGQQACRKRPEAWNISTSRMAPQAS